LPRYIVREIFKTIVDENIKNMPFSSTELAFEVEKEWIDTDLFKKNQV
jgi:hypothetical protein